MQPGFHHGQTLSPGDRQAFQPEKRAALALAAAPGAEPAECITLGRPAGAGLQPGARAALQSAAGATEPVIAATAKSAPGTDIRPASGRARHPASHRAVRTLAATGIQTASTLALAFVVALALGYFAPGTAVDSRELDPSLSEETRQQIRSERSRLLFGWSSIQYGVPVAALIAARWRFTSESCLYGWLGAWSLTAMLLLLAAFFPGLGPALSSAGLALLCVPAGVVAVLCFISQWPVAVPIAAATFPRVYLFVSNILRNASRSPHVVTARAKGCPRVTIFLRHEFWPHWPEIAAVAAVSVTIALSVAIPAEVFHDAPGLGQLAWKAAAARDLPLLLALTLALALVTVAANTLAELCQRRVHK
jgi:peptide/nickel transport system permease protein